MRLNEHLCVDVELPLALRDVGAHAFSNGIFGLPPCQAVEAFVGQQTVQESLLREKFYT